MAIDPDWARDGLMRCEELLDRPARPTLRAAIVRLRDWYAEVFDVVRREDWRPDELPELPSDVVHAARSVAHSRHQRITRRHSVTRP